MKKLYRTNNRTIAGVCGGLGEYYNIDPTVMRVGVAAATIATGGFPGVFMYIAAAIIIPNEPN